MEAGARGRRGAGLRLEMDTELPVPPTHYAQSGTVNIAYQVVGDGPADLVVVDSS